MNHDYARIEEAIRFLRGNLDSQPGIERVAAHVGISVYHFHRLFRRWTGVSPKRYLELLTVNQARQLLDGKRSILDVSYELGLSSASRLHDQFVSIEAVSPGEFRKRGRGLAIEYGVHVGPFGETLIATTRRGICLVAFTHRLAVEGELSRLQRLYPGASLRENNAAVAGIAAPLFAAQGDASQPFHLLLKGTNLQIQVWRALLRIARGETLGYRELAANVGRPEAVRAVANAVAANPVNFLIPCHRVLRADGTIGGFRGGIKLKQQLLGREAGANNGG